MAGAFSDPARLRIANLLWHGQEVCNCQIEPVTGYLPSKISRHLGLLKRAGLLSERREGTFIYYRLKEPVGEVHAALLGLLARICESDPVLRNDRARFDRGCCG